MIAMVVREGNGADRGLGYRYLDMVRCGALSWSQESYIIFLTFLDFFEK